MAELERESQMFKNCFGGLENHLCDDDDDDGGDDEVDDDHDNGEFEKMIKINRRFDEYETHLVRSQVVLPPCIYCPESTSRSRSNKSTNCLVIINIVSIFSIHYIALQPLGIKV